jgi:regulation of enolase protein 1 (concanavalin A-like superfamily)
LITQRELKKTRKGWLGNKVKQIHLRDDIPCGLEYCQKHANQSVVFTSDSSAESTIFILDTDTLIEQTDIVYNCNEMRNVVFLQSSIEKLKRK